MTFTRKILSFFIFPTLVLVLHLFLMFFTPVYSLFHWLDRPMHLLGGFSVGITFYLIVNYLAEEKYWKIPRAGRIFLILSSVALVAVMWELFEFFLTQITGIVFQGDLEDSMIDLFLGLAGGLFASAFVWRD